MIDVIEKGHVSILHTCSSDSHRIASSRRDIRRVASSRRAKVKGIVIFFITRHDSYLAFNVQGCLMLQSYELHR